MKNTRMCLDGINGAGMTDALRADGGKKPDVRPTVHQYISRTQPFPEKLYIGAEKVGVLPQDGSPYGRRESQINAARPDLEPVRNPKPPQHDGGESSRFSQS